MTLSYHFHIGRRFIFNPINNLLPTGEVFESKQEHCNNLLHLIDFALMNREPDTTNIFLRSNDHARVHACDNGADCIENSPLFSLVGM